MVVSETPSPSPTPTALSDDELLAMIPEEAQREDFFGASAFAKFFVDLYPDLFESPPKPELFNKLSAEVCKFCAGALADAAATQDAGAHNTGGEFAWPDELARGGLNDDGYWYVTQAFEVADTVTYLADGSVYKTEAGGTGEVGLKLDFAEGAWSVLGVEFVYDR